MQIHSESSILTTEQKQAFQRDGFLVINDFISPEICESLMQRAHTLIEQFVPNTEKTVFSANDQRHSKHQYFLDSGDKIRFFFEEGAINAEGELTQNKLLSINKIGHAMHDLDPVFNCFSRMHKIAKLAEEIEISNPLLLQSMYICKQPRIGGEVNCHQDATYIYVEGKPVVGYWFALEDATLENGCLWAIPGGHRSPLKSRSRRHPDDSVSIDVYDETPWELNNMVPLEVPRGSVILLHGLLPHMSKENHSAKSRHAYALHIISGDHEYASDNWLQRSNDMPLRGFV